MFKLRITKEPDICTFEMQLPRAKFFVNDFLNETAEWSGSDD